MSTPTISGWNKKEVLISSQLPGEGTLNQNVVGCEIRWEIHLSTCEQTEIIAKMLKKFIKLTRFVDLVPVIQAHRKRSGPYVWFLLCLPFFYALSKFTRLLFPHFSWITHVFHVPCRYRFHWNAITAAKWMNWLPFRSMLIRCFYFLAFFFSLSLKIIPNNNHSWHIIKPGAILA